MKKTIFCLALAGAGLALGGCSNSEQISGSPPPQSITAPPPGGSGDCQPAGTADCPRQPVPAIMPPGHPWHLNGAAYTVDWTVTPSGAAGDPRPTLDIDVHVDNKGPGVVLYPDPAVTYDGNPVAVGGWTQPLAGAELSPGQSGDYRSAFRLPYPGGRVLVEVRAFAGDAQAKAYWSGTVAA